MSVDVEAPSGAEQVSRPRMAATRPRAAQSVARTAWEWSWPKLVAVGLVILIWQVTCWSGHWSPDILPTPYVVAQQLWDMLTSAPNTHLWGSIETTLRRAATGYVLALVIGTLIGVAVVQWKVFRRGVGSLVAGMQTMPSIAWFPLAILLFGITEKAILFVVILGAAPSIASGVITGIDEVPPPLLRAGKMLGARGINRYRHIVLPAAMPSYVQGMKQGWAFSWRSLLAGELLVSVAGSTSIGGDLNLARQTFHPPLVIALMVVILVIGMIVDGLFGFLTKSIRNKRGLTGAI
jgi:NitT/TauT family transport system permease protein